MQRIEELYQKYIDGCASEMEKSELFHGLHKADDKDLTALADRYLSVREPMGLNDLQEDTDRILQRIRSQIGTPQDIGKKPEKVAILRRWLTAAAVVLVLGFAGYQVYRLQHTSFQQQANNAYGEDLAPGGNRATLQLSDGTVFQLAEDREELRVSTSSYTYEDGEHVGGPSGTATSATLATPRGGQYRIVLPDGTKVWLNAASSLTYPTTFEEENRTVHISGEVYFDVAKNPKKPFIVYAEKQKIEVLGTSFNVNTYGDQGSYLTTLVEGSLRLTSSQSNKDMLISPGQQVIVTETGEMKAMQVDTEEFASWKDGVYIVNNLPLYQFGKQIERWYDVEVDMGKYKNRKLSATIRRDVKLAEVLAAIELKTKIKFMTKERRVSAVE